MTALDRLIPPRSGLRLRIMGVVNVTPDSFYDGGHHATADTAVDHALRQIDEGADVIDVGGESTRPGSAPVGTEVELGRVLPVIERIAKRSDVPISVDTTKAAVARRACDAGARIVNDVSGGAFDPDMARAVADAGAAVVLGHTSGRPSEMQERTGYTDVVDDVRDALRASADAMAACGVARDRILVDPGVGFGKTAEQSVRLLAHVDAFGQLGYPVVIGASRKSVIGRILGALPSHRDPRGGNPDPGRRAEDRLFGSLGAAAAAAVGGAHVLRVHDVRATRELVAVLEAVRRTSADRRTDG